MNAPRTSAFPNASVPAREIGALLDISAYINNNKIGIIYMHYKLKSIKLYLLKLFNIQFVLLLWFQ